MSLRQIELPGLPERPLRPRSDGLTLALDKGLSARQAEDFMDVASEFVDFVKLGWGTAVITPNLRRKLDVYREAGTAALYPASRAASIEPSQAVKVEG